MDNFDLGYFVFMDECEKRQKEKPKDEGEEDDEEEAGAIFRATEKICPHH